MLPAFNTIYQYYSDNVARLATITIENDTSPSLSGDDAYGPSALVDDNPAKLAKINATSGAWIFAFAAPQPLKLAALIHHSFDETPGSPAGSPEPSVRLEGNSTSDFSSPLFSATFTIPAWLGGTTAPWPVNPFLRLEDLAGYDPAGFAYWRLVIENNSQNIQLGQIWLSDTIRTFDPDLRWGLTPTVEKPIIENRTGSGVSTIYSRGTTWWKQEADLLATDSLADDLEAHWYEVDGRVLPWLLIPSGPGDTPGCRLVRYAMTDRAASWDFNDLHTLKLVFEEVRRGRRPGV